MHDHSIWTLRRASARAAKGPHARQDSNLRALAPEANLTGRLGDDGGGRHACEQAFSSLIFPLADIPMSGFVRRLDPREPGESLAVGCQLRDQGLECRANPAARTHAASFSWLKRHLDPLRISL